MSYGAILGQTPPQPEFKPIASDISYSPSSSQGVISGNNVQSALDQVAGYSKTTRDTANNANSNANSALSMARMFDGYEIDGYIESYWSNESLPINTMNKISIPWTVKPSTSKPEIVLIQIEDEKINTKRPINSDTCLIAVGPKIQDMFSKSISNPGLYIGGTPKTNYNYNNAYSTKNINYSGPFVAYKLGKQNISSYFDMVMYCLYGEGSYTSGYGPQIVTSRCRAYLGSFEWDGNYFYYKLHIDESTCTSLGFAVYTLKSVKS